MEKPVSYFAAGPAKIPEEVLKEIQNELLHFKNTGVSAMEISHRSSDFNKVITEAETLVRELLNVPGNYKILFMQGGATGLFAAVPLNLLKNGKASYFVTGSWSEKAAKECKKFGEMKLVLPDQDKYRGLPSKETWNIDPQSSYVYFCMNETVHGVEFSKEPEAPAGIPLVCDMSSNFFSRPIDVSKYGMIFGGAQKNIGCAGVTVVIIREDLLGHCNPMCPSVLDFTVMAKNKSLYNTPPTFAIYVMGRVLSWIKRSGGLDGMSKNSDSKSSLLYSSIDNSDDFYTNKVDVAYRSRMNVVFNVGRKGEPDEDLEKQFIEEAAKEGLLSLKGHRSIGGVRASLYNALTMQDATKLVDFMKKFKGENFKV